MLNLLRESVDLFLPRFCINCNTKLAVNETWLCNNCYLGMPTLEKDEINSFYIEKFPPETGICSLFSYFKYQKANTFQKLIHKLKYSGYYRIGTFLGNLLGERIKAQNLFTEYNLLIPVPIHKIKKIERGYNQTEYFAKELSKLLKIQCKNDLLIRKIYKESQTKHNKAERLKNVQGIFEVNKPEYIKNKNIIIIDDIVTTGATVNEISKICKKAGANKISVITAGLTHLNG